MKERKRIRAAAAAALLGCTKENVYQLINEGTLSGISVCAGKRNERYVFEDEVLARKEACHESISLARDTEAVLERARQLNREALRAERDATERLRAASNWKSTQQRLSELLTAILDELSGEKGLTQREKDILSDIVCLVPMDAVLDKWGLSYQQVRQIMTRGVLKLVRGKDLIERYNELLQDYCGLAKKFGDMTEKLERLAPILTPDKFEYTAHQLEIRDKLLRPIEGLNLSTHLYRVLTEGLGARTVADVAYFSLLDLRKVRQLGGVSLKELIKVFDKMGLNFNMDPAQYGINVSKECIDNKRILDCK